MDLQDVNKQVPLAPPTPYTPAVFVLGGKNDVVIDVPVGSLAGWGGLRLVGKCCRVGSRSCP